MTFQKLTNSRFFFNAKAGDQSILKRPSSLPSQGRFFGGKTACDCLTFRGLNEAPMTRGSSWWQHCNMNPCPHPLRPVAALTARFWGVVMQKEITRELKISKEDLVKLLRIPSKFSWTLAFPIWDVANTRTWTSYKGSRYTWFSLSSYVP